MWIAVVVLLAQPAVIDVNKKLDEAGRADAVVARKLLSQVVKDLRDAHDLTARERHDVLNRLARVILAKAQTTGDVQEIVGSESPRKVSRQVLFRRYVEQWSFDSHLSLVVTFECSLGQELRLRGVRVLSP